MATRKSRIGSCLIRPMGLELWPVRQQHASAHDSHHRNSAMVRNRATGHGFDVP
jgi:hypothetical protein